MAQTRDESSVPFVCRLPVRLTRNERRVILLPFGLEQRERVRHVFERVDALSRRARRPLLDDILASFDSRHRDFAHALMEHYAAAQRMLGDDKDRDATARQLIGAYFSMEYSIESAALFNPSMVPHPDQGGVPPGARRFVMSLRATGEGHLSSTVFQTGIVSADHHVQLDPLGDCTARTRLAPDHHYEKPTFRRKLNEMGVAMNACDRVLHELEEAFTLSELDDATVRVRNREHAPNMLEDAIQAMLWLARSNYKLRLDPRDDIANLVMFPHSDNEVRGIEDLRLVRFEDDDHATYYGTYTAVSGQRMLPTMLQTDDFRSIRVHTLNGRSVQNKGMALFPRRIDGHYVMCSRIDGRSLYLMFSDYPYFWESAELLAEPCYPWEMTIIGNCGSPIETDAGWLLITHGVGPMRRYCLGAMLLDLDNPRKILGRLREPLLTPSQDEREGYVPNVVYSCGSMLHGDRLYIPYAASDMASTMAQVRLNDLLEQLLRDGPGPRRARHA